MSASSLENKLEELFNKMDKDGSGDVNRKEFRRCLQKFNLSDAKIEELFRMLDGQGKQDGKIGKAEFVRGAKRIIEQQRK